MPIQAESREYQVKAEPFGATDIWIFRTDDLKRAEDVFAHWFEQFGNATLCSRTEELGPVQLSDVVPLRLVG